MSRIASARRSWDAGNAFEAGKELLAPLGPEEVVLVARAAVEFLREHRRIDLWMRRLKAVLADSDRWSEAHGVFDDLRRLLLELQDRDRNPEEELAYSALFVGESAARVAYNATDPSDPFDEDTEPWIVACLHHYASSLQDDQALDRAWDAVSRALPGRIGDGSSGGGVSA